MEYNSAMKKKTTPPITADEEMQGRLLAVGDIHGCLDPLRQLMEQVRPMEEDRIVFLGDYIDRGPHSRGVIDYLLDLGRRFPRTVFLKGNHEAMFLDFLRGAPALPFLVNGGLATLRSYEMAEDSNLPREHRDFFEALLPLWQCRDFVFVHAGLRPQVPIDEQDEADLLWIRGEFMDSDYDWGKTVVFGHTPLLQPLLRPRRIGLDTGAVYGRALTCCEVRSRVLWSQQA